MTKGEVAMAVFLDVANGINSLPWIKIRTSPIRHRIPDCLRKGPPPQGLRSSVLKHSRLQYGLSDPGVPKLVVYRKPVVMFHGSGGLALTGWSARLITSIKSP